MLKTKFMPVAVAACLVAFPFTPAPFVATATAQSQAVQDQCDGDARRMADSQKDTAGNVVGGAITGAVGGALIGAIAGKNKVDNGAAIGAGVGAVGGLAHNSSKWKKHYNKAYKECITKAMAVPPPPPPPPKPVTGTPAWYDYCRAKYRSFNSQTGLYLSTDGTYKPCQ